MPTITHGVWTGAFQGGSTGENAQEFFGLGVSCCQAYGFSHLSGSMHQNRIGRLSRRNIGKTRCPNLPTGIAQIRVGGQLLIEGILYVEFIHYNFFKKHFNWALVQCLKP